jgi:hypothetical protein
MVRPRTEGYLQGEVLPQALLDKGSLLHSLQAQGQSCGARDRGVGHGAPPTSNQVLREVRVSHLRQGPLSVPLHALQEGKTCPKNHAT